MTTLSGVLPETINGFNALSNYASSQGITIGIANYGGLRTLSDTTTILKYRQHDYNAARAAGQIRPDTTLQQFRPIAPFGSSYHNYGAAFDVQIIARPTTISDAQALGMLGSYAPSIGLRWGGTFANQDPPHFELAIPLSDAQARYQAMIASGGAGVLDSLSYDISSLLPGTDEDESAVFDTPASDVAADDSGSAALAYGPGQDSGPPMSLVVIGLAVAGFVLWAIRRKFQ